MLGTSSFPPRPIFDSLGAAFSKVGDIAGVTRADITEKMRNVTSRKRVQLRGTGKVCFFRFMAVLLATIMIAGNVITLIVIAACCIAGKGCAPFRFLAYLWCKGDPLSRKDPLPPSICPDAITVWVILQELKNETDQDKLVSVLTGRSPNNTNNAFVDRTFLHHILGTGFSTDIKCMAIELLTKLDAEPLNKVLCTTDNKNNNQSVVDSILSYTPFSSDFRFIWEKILVLLNARLTIDACARIFFTPKRDCLQRTMLHDFMCRCIAGCHGATASVSDEKFIHKCVVAPFLQLLQSVASCGGAYAQQFAESLTCEDSGGRTVLMDVARWGDDFIKKQFENLFKQLSADSQKKGHAQILFNSSR